MTVTLRDIAERDGVSVTTVSRTLAGCKDFAEGTRLRVRAVAAELGYHPNLVARRLQKRRSGTEAVEHLLGLKPPLTAIIGGNDLTALGAMNRLQQRGLGLGVDMAMGCFHDVPMAAFANPPLTTIRRPIHEIGRMACSMLIDIIKDRDPAIRASY